MTDIERLKELREQWGETGSEVEESVFAQAAYVALATDGCVTVELERLRDELETQTVGHRGAVDGWNEVRAECAALREQLTAAQRAIKDAQKENAYLLARLVKMRESVLRLAVTHSSYPDRPLTSADGLAVALHKLLEK